MSGKGRQGPNDRWRQMALSRKRGTKRQARKGKIYDPYSWSLKKHVPKPNPRIRLKGKARGTKMIEFPGEVLFGTPEEVDLAVGLISELRSSALDGSFKRIVIDHSKLERLAPEVALLLLAEIQRCEAYCRSRTKITGIYPQSHDVAELLTEIGFFDALGIKAPVLPATHKPRTYVRIERHNKATARLAHSLLECFSKEFTFDDDDRKRLHVALVECMDNVFEHAYKFSSKEPYLYKEWWLVGYADHSDSSIGFMFYDQGAGIPKTIRRRKKRRVLDRLSGWTDANWIHRAVRKQISRHRSGRRGHGLEKLKRFLDRLDVEGSLRVLANRGDVEFFTSGKPARVVDLDRALDGTLIVWKLRGESRAESSTERIEGNA